MALMDTLLRREQTEAEQAEQARRERNAAMDKARRELAKMAAGKQYDESAIGAVVKSSDHLQRCLDTAADALRYGELQDAIAETDADIQQVRDEIRSIEDRLTDAGTKSKDAGSIACSVGRLWKSYCGQGSEGPSFERLTAWRQAARELEDLNDRCLYLRARSQWLTAQRDRLAEDARGCEFQADPDSQNASPLNFKFPWSGQE